MICVGGLAQSLLALTNISFLGTRESCAGYGMQPKSQFFFDWPRAGRHASVEL